MSNDLIFLDSRGVSPVIGVILMVAITVILAAVIGTFVTDLGQGVNENVQAGANVDFDDSDNTVRVTYNSNQDPNSILEVNFYNENGPPPDSTDNVLEDVGTSIQYSADDGDRIHVLIVAVNGKRETVIYDKTHTV